MEVQQYSESGIGSHFKELVHAVQYWYSSFYLVVEIADNKFRAKGLAKVLVEAHLQVLSDSYNI